MHEHFIKLKKLLSKPKKVDILESDTISDKKEDVPGYFKLARSWADDYYVGIQASRNRWRAACLYICLPLMALLLIWVTLLIPAQRLVPVEVDHYTDGVVSVKLAKGPFEPKNRAEVESQIVQYVTNFESYSAPTYKAQYGLINSMSNDQVFKQYVKAQSVSNKNSPINVLGSQGVRTVKVKNVIFLDNINRNDPEMGQKRHRNLVQVNFTVTEHDSASGQKTTVPLMALISWDYRGTPESLLERWRNWDGFTVTYYHLQQRNV